MLLIRLARLLVAHCVSHTTEASIAGIVLLYLPGSTWGDKTVLATTAATTEKTSVKQDQDSNPSIQSNTDGGTELTHSAEISEQGLCFDMYLHFSIPVIDCILHVPIPYLAMYCIALPTLRSEYGVSTKEYNIKRDGVQLCSNLAVFECAKAILLLFLLL